MKLKESYIVLQDLRFHAYHGVLPQERLTGNDYVVNLRIGYDICDAMLSDDVITGGYYLVPVKLPNGKSTRTWNCSLPFNVKAGERMTE